jgi:hypothetical protein
VKRRTTVMGMLGACGKIKAHSSNFLRNRKFSDTDALEVVVVVVTLATFPDRNPRRGSPAIARIA